MTDQVGIDLALNTQDWSQGAGLALQQSNALNASLGGLAITAGQLQTSLNRGTPSRAHMAAFGGFAAAAAQSQQQLAGLNATQAVTGQRADSVSRSMRQLARDLPVGNAAAQQTVQTYTQMGLSMQSQVKQVQQLSKMALQLQGANGGYAPQYAQSMVQLERTFGDQGLDPKRMQATADALTTVSKLGGAPAQGVLDFANQIGPMTQQAGIGATATLGIATAFSRIGQDGTAAGTAVNKMLGDMSRAVRDGGPQMNTYANIVGTTADNFQRLFKSNPTEALTQVTEAIGKAGSTGPRILENLGLDGVRTQRALQALSASGGLRAQVSTAVQGYGSGSTAKAADAAYSGVLDNFEKVSSSAGQVAVALGSPLLRPLGLFSSLLAKSVGGIAHFMDTALGKGTAEAIAIGGLGLLGARKLFGFGVGTAALRQGATSGPVMSYVAGRRMARGDEVGRDAEGNITNIGRGRTGVRAGYMGRAYEEDRLGTGIMGGINTRMFGAGMGVSQADMTRRMRDTAALSSRLERVRSVYGDDHPVTQRLQSELDSQRIVGPGQANRPGMFGTVRRGVSGVAGTFMAGYSSVIRAGIDQSNEPDPTRRQAVGQQRMQFLGGAGGRFIRDAARNAPVQGPVEMDGTAPRGAGMSGAFRDFNRNLQESGRRFPAFLSGLRSVGGAGIAGIGAGAANAGRGAVGVARGMWGMMGGLSGLGLMAGFAGIGYLANKGSSDAAARKAEVDRQYNASPMDQINSYSDSIGKATASTSNFASSVDSSTKLVSTSVNNMAAALKVRPDDVTASQNNQKVVQQFDKNATPDQLAAQIRQMAPTGMDPSVLNAIKIDLLRQFPQQQVQQTLNKVGNVSTAGTPATRQKDLQTLVAEASGTNINESWAPDANKVSAHDYYNHMPFQGYSSKPATRKLYDTISGSITQTHDAAASVVSGSYAEQQRLRDVNTAMAAAARGGNEAVTNDLGDQLAREQLGFSKGKTIPRVTSDDIRKYGGYVQALAAKDPKGFGKRLADMERSTGQGGQGITLSGQGVSASATLSFTGRQVRDAVGGDRNNMIAQDFDNTLQNPRLTGHRSDRMPANLDRMTAVQNRDLMQQSLLHPENQQLATQAVEGLVGAASKGGKSLDDLATSANKAAVANGDVTSAAYAQLVAIRQEAQFQQSARAPFQTSGQNLASTLKSSAGIIAAGPGTTPDSKKSYDDARQQYAAALGQMNDQIKQRLLAERNYQIQSSRATEDYNRQVGQANQDFQTQQTFSAQDYYKQKGYAQADYQRQAYTSTRDFQTQVARSEQDYQLQLFRTDQDYDTQRTREIRDFNTQMARGQDDYFTTRSRAIRDFNIQMARQIQDQTKDLYDPYKRIQTQAVWDGSQLLANMNEQNAAIKNQQSQLDQVRKMGLTDATIQQLGLNNPANAQQLAKLVDDFMSDPKLAKQLNDSTNTRISIGKLLITDPSNVDIARAKADFSKQLSDMAADESKQVSRARADMNKQLGDQAADFARGLARMGTDFNTQLQRGQYDFDVAMGDSAYAYQVAMARADDAYQTSVSRSLVLFQTQMSRMNTEYTVAMKRMRQDTTESEKELSLSLTQMWDTANKIMRGKNVDTNKLMRDGLTDTLTFVKSGKNQKDLTTAYKNVFPYDLSHVFGGGPDPGVATPHGGPYAPYANAGAQQAIFGGRGAGASVTQGFGEDRSGAANTGGGWPVASPTITQGFGKHPGIDLAVPTGTPIHAPLPGVVVYAGWNDGYGNCVIMDNGGGRSTLYGHQQAINAKVGDVLKAGALIGWVDSTGNSTGPHLHFETRQNGLVQNPAIDLPMWQATAGLGSFDPGKVAAGYGVTLEDPSADVKKELDKRKKEKKGPFGSYISSVNAMKAAAEDFAKDSVNPSMGAMVTGDQSGPYQDYAKKLLKQYGWGDQWNSFDYVEMREAGWNPRARNPSSGAYGMAQALPPDKYASAGADWMTNGYTQLDWMMNYIQGRYGDPNAAAAHEKNFNWYGTGYVTNGPVATGPNAGAGERGKEVLLPLNNAGVSVLAQAFGMAVSADQLRTMTTAGSSDRVTYVSQLSHEDHSVTIAAEKLEVTDGDPMSMARKLEAKARSDRLTKGKKS